MKKSKKAIQPDTQVVQSVTAQLDELCATRDEWQQGEYARSNETLYSLLAGCLNVYQTDYLCASADTKTKIRLDMTAKLEQDGAGVQSNSQMLTMLIRYVFRTDRKRAAKYAYVLNAALADQQTGETLAAWVKEQGGIEELNRRIPINEDRKAKREKLEAAVADVRLKMDAAKHAPLATIELQSGMTLQGRGLLVAEPSPDGTIRIVGLLPSASKKMIEAIQREIGRFKLAQQAPEAAVDREEQLRAAQETARQIRNKETSNAEQGVPESKQDTKPTWGSYKPHGAGVQMRPMLTGSKLLSSYRTRPRGEHVKPATSTSA